MSALVFYASASELATLTNTFRVAGVATDPTTVTLTITTPAGVATSYTYAAAEITKTATGVYTKDIPCTEAGEWQYVWTGTGSASDVQAGTWTVYETTLGKLYCTVDALKSRLGIPLTSTVDDYELHAACFSASRAIEHDCERHFWRTASAEARTFTPGDAYCLKLPEFSDLVSVTTLKTDDSGDGTYDITWASTDFQLWPGNSSAAPEPRPYTRVLAVGSYTFPTLTVTGRTDRVEITGVWGWASVPWGIKQAALIAAADTYKLKDAPFGVAGFGDFGPMRVGTNRAADRYLAPYRRNVIQVR